MSYQSKTPITSKPTLSQQGYSLVELMIVMAILMVVAAVAVPNYLAARARANEASATGSVRAIITAQNLYRNTFGNYTQLGDLGADYLTDDLLAAGEKSGYRFTSDPDGLTPTLFFTTVGTPKLAFGASATGSRAYYGDQSGVVRFNMAQSGTPPDVNSPVIQ